MTLWLKHVGTGRLYPHTDALSQREDMVPFNGKPPKRRFVTPKETVAKAAAARANDPETIAAQNLAAARAKFEDVFGKAAHPNMKLDTIEARLAEKEAEDLMAGELVPIPEGTEPAASDGDDKTEEDEGDFGFGTNLTEE